MKLLACAFAFVIYFTTVESHSRECEPELNRIIQSQGLSSVVEMVESITKAPVTTSTSNGMTYVTSKQVSGLLTGRELNVAVGRRGVCSAAASWTLPGHSRDNRTDWDFSSAVAYRAEECHGLAYRLTQFEIRPEGGVAIEATWKRPAGGTASFGSVITSASTRISIRYMRSFADDCS